MLSSLGNRALWGIARYLETTTFSALSDSIRETSTVTSIVRERSLLDPDWRM
jgi:hypothetical protein